MLLRAAVDAFLLQLQADGRSPHTIGQYRRHVGLLDAWLAGTRRRRTLGAIDHEVLARFLVDDAARKRPDGAEKKATSTNALRTSLRAFFAYAHAAGMVAENPARLIRRARCAPPPPRTLSAEEVCRLLAAVDSGTGAAAARDRALIRLLLGTGLRLSSALGLAGQDVDLAEGALHIRRAKNDRPTTLPISRGVARELAAYLRQRPDGLLFPGHGGAPLTRRQAGRRIEAWAAAAGLSGRATAHALRHTFATQLYGRIGDLLVVQQALAHRSVTSTTVYATLAPGKLRAALRSEGKRATAGPADAARSRTSGR
jgi:integrase/recombinase XerC